jgi:hypothetical protein
MIRGPSGSASILHESERRRAEEGRGRAISPCRGEGAERPFPTKANNEHTRRRRSRSQFAHRLTGLKGQPQEVQHGAGRRPGTGTDCPQQAVHFDLPPLVPAFPTSLRKPYSATWRARVAFGCSVPLKLTTAAYAGLAGAAGKHLFANSGRSVRAELLKRVGLCPSPHLPERRDYRLSSHPLDEMIQSEAAARRLSTTGRYLRSGSRVPLERGIARGLGWQTLDLALLPWLAVAGAALAGPPAATTS